MITVDYEVTHGQHRVADIQTNGAVVIPEDGSGWLVYNGFVPVSSSWALGEMIHIKKSRDPEYPYKLINVHRNESVEATRRSTEQE